VELKDLTETVSSSVPLLTLMEIWPLQWMKLNNFLLITFYISFWITCVRVHV